MHFNFLHLYRKIKSRATTLLIAVSTDTQFSSLFHNFCYDRVFCLHKLYPDTPQRILVSVQWRACSLVTLVRIFQACNML